MPAEPIDLGALLRAADRKALGAEFARTIGDVDTAVRIDKDAALLYAQALSVDPGLVDPAWAMVDRRDRHWLDRNGFSRVPSA